MNTLKYTLLFVSVLAACVLWIACCQYGFLLFLDEIQAKGELPGTPGVSWIKDYTGIAGVERWVEIFVLIFWPVLSGNSPAMSLHLVALLGAALAGWVLIALEACRTKPLSQVILRMTIFGLCLSCLGAGVVMPFYMALNLPPPVTPIHRTSRSNDNIKKGNYQYRQDSSSGNAPFPIGFSGAALIGYLLATTPLFLPVPGVVSYEFKQLSIWWFLFGWPIFIALLVRIMPSSREYPGQGIINRLDGRSICVLAFAASWLPLLVHTIYSLAVNTGLFGPLYLQEYYIGWSMYYPRLPRSPESLFEASYLFWQWDYVMTCVSVFIWSFGLYFQTHRQAKLSINYMQLVPMVLVLGFFAGLPAVGAMLIWERHQILERMSLAESKDE